MKNILLAAFLFTVPVVAFSQSKALNKFYRKHKRGSDVKNMKLPSFLIRTGGKIAIKNSDMPSSDEEIARELLKKAGGIKFMYSEDGSRIPKKDINQLKKDLSKENFDDLIMIKSMDMDFQIMINESGGMVKSLFMLYNNLEDGQMAFISLKTKITFDDIKALVGKGMEEHYHEIMEIEEEPVVEPIM